MFDNKGAFINDVIHFGGGGGSSFQKMILDDLQNMTR